MVFGYARVSRLEQSLDRQMDELRSAGVDEIITEKVTGTKADRPELLRLLDKLRGGDVVVVADMTRLGRSTRDLFLLADKIHYKGADLRSLKENWLDTTTPQGKFFFTVIAGVSQFERDLIVQRTNEGLAAARARGRVGGRRAKLDAPQRKALYELYMARTLPIVELCRMFGISKPTLYKTVRETAATFPPMANPPGTSEQLP